MGIKIKRLDFGDWSFGIRIGYWDYEFLLEIWIGDSVWGLGLGSALWIYPKIIVDPSLLTEAPFQELKKKYSPLTSSYINVSQKHGIGYLIFGYRSLFVKISITKIKTKHAQSFAFDLLDEDESLTGNACRKQKQVLSVF